MKTNPQGLLISFEGPEGSGKSTLVTAIAARLYRNLGREVVVIRNPQAGPLRELVLSKEHSFSKGAELMLFLADRYEAIYKQVLPALRDNKIVVLDRWLHSTVALQGVVRGNSQTVRHFIAADKALKEVADVTFLLEAPCLVLEERLQKRIESNKLDVDFSPQNSISAYNRAEQMLQGLRYLEGLENRTPQNSRYDWETLNAVKINADQSTEEMVNDCLKALCNNPLFQIAQQLDADMFTPEEFESYQKLLYLNRVGKTS